MFVWFCVCVCVRICGRVAAGAGVCEERREVWGVVCVVGEVCGEVGEVVLKMERGCNPKQLRIP